MTLSGFVAVEPAGWDALFAPSSLLSVITTLDTEGRVNAAPIGTCTRVCHAPVCVAFTVGANKDTYHNVLSTGEFVVNVPSLERALLEKVSMMGVEYAPEVNEVSQVGLTTLAASRVAPPIIAEFGRHFECEVLWTKEWMHRLMVVGRVVAAAVRPDLIGPDGRIVWDRARPAHYCGVAYGNRYVAAYEQIVIESPFPQRPPFGSKSG